MILQRIAASLKKRDWGTVVLEVLVVVVGIFIGLQVDDWNDARKDRQAEHVYLTRLLDDLDKSLDALTSERSDMETWVEQTWALVRGFEAGEPARALVKENERGLLASTRVLFGRGQFATITELIEGGRLGVIRNPEIRGAIAATEGLAESRRIQIQALSRQQQALVPYIRTRFRVSPDIDGSGPKFDYDFDELSRDAVFINSLSQASNNLRVNIIWATDVIREITALRSLVAEEIERAGNRESAP